MYGRITLLQTSYFSKNQGKRCNVNTSRSSERTVNSLLDLFNSCLSSKGRSILRAYDRVSILCRNALLSRASINI